MKPVDSGQLTYSSVLAFIEHFRALEGASTRNVDEQRRFEAMKELMSVLDATEFAALKDNKPSGAAYRHRERALHKLRRELLARGVITG